MGFWQMCGRGLPGLPKLVENAKMPAKRVECGRFGGNFVSTVYKTSSALPIHGDFNHIWMNSAQNQQNHQKPKKNSSGNYSASQWQEGGGKTH